MLIAKYNESVKKHYRENIKNRALTGLPLTQKERALFLLYIGNAEQVQQFLKLEKIKTAI